MAEGDTVLAAAERLREGLSGRVLVRTDFRVPRAATVDLSSQRVLEVAARGKHLLLRTDRDRTVHSHLGMDGGWRLYAPGQRWRGRAFEVRGVLETEDTVAVGHRLRTLEVIPTSAEERLLAHLGPDVLGRDWDPTEVVRRLTADPDRPVGDALIDQTVMAGPGNVYRSEACFLAGIDPRMSVAAIPDPAALVGIVKDLMERNRSGGRRQTTGDPRPGRQLWVYGRARRPCRRCGTLIVSFEQGAREAPRIAFACPRCQAFGSPSLSDA